MKTFLTYLLLIAAVSSCSKIEINEDSIIGIYEANVKTVSETRKIAMDTEEWIFNDINLGRYHAYNRGEIVESTDFNWSNESGVYTISYPGTDIPSQQVRLVHDENGTHLQHTHGGDFAKKMN